MRARSGALDIEAVDYSPLFCYLYHIIDKIYNYAYYMIMMKKMPKIFPKEKLILEAFGERLRLARRRRKMTTEMVAARAGISRTTLSRAEKGSSKVSMGVYFRILTVLHLESDFDKLASDDVLGRELQDLALK